ncbi:unnamed protein product [Nyctereutes procyonoides]|uniref:(raccoon dog) hypothetical protein n=1 Tax=Nyctereutes procyonoides TaxID=34880 RepID=A0A811ZQB7_NYCPR|nr:unnamed protein product [Nyctereutes procyonoides]
MKIHDFSLSGLLELKSSEKDSWLRPCLKRTRLSLLPIVSTNVFSCLDVLSSSCFLLIEWLQLSGFENLISESTTVCNQRFTCNIWNTSGGLHQHRIYKAAGASQS